jgi:hypothetical protein
MSDTHGGWREEQIDELNGNIERIATALEELKEMFEEDGVLVRR